MPKIYDLTVGGFDCSPALKQEARLIKQSGTDIIREKKPCQDAFILFFEDDDDCNDNCKIGHGLRDLLEILMMREFLMRLLKAIDELFKNSLRFPHYDVRPCVQKQHNNDISLHRPDDVSCSYEIEKRSVFVNRYGDKIRYSEMHIHSDGTASGYGSD